MKQLAREYFGNETADEAQDSADCCTPDPNPDFPCVVPLFRSRDDAHGRCADKALPDGDLGYVSLGQGDELLDRLDIVRCFRSSSNRRFTGFSFPVVDAEAGARSVNGQQETVVSGQVEEVIGIRNWLQEVIGPPEADLRFFAELRPDGLKEVVEIVPTRKVDSARDVMAGYPARAWPSVPGWPKNKGACASKQFQYSPS